MISVSEQAQSISGADLGVNHAFRLFQRENGRTKIVVAIITAGYTGK